MDNYTKPKKLKLNLGCGNNKIQGYINIDIEKSCKPDLVVDFRVKMLPYINNSVDEVLLFHCIEHIEKIYHRWLLIEINRVLKADGVFYMSYPNFIECAQRWKDNTEGKREFWEATLFGRQLYKGDYHVCAMGPDIVEALLYECGFKNVSSFPEPEVYNTITKAQKDAKGPMLTYEKLVALDMQSMVVKEL